ncbi:MAG: PDZ domain-containing protein [Planctomycetota bacterium]
MSRPNELTYTLDATQPAEHRVHVELRLQPALVSQDRDAGIELYLPVWTPGSYMVREYSRHIESFTAVGARTGAALDWSKTSKNTYRVRAPDEGEAIIRYTVYGHELTVRTADFTAEHVFFDGACLFLWPRGAETQRASLHLRVPPDWRIATQLPTVDGDPSHRVAQGLADIVDAPVLAGRFQEVPFEVLGTPHRFVLDGLDGVSVPETLVPDTVAVIEEAAAIFGGELPYDDYQFLALFAHEGRGGLEHTRSSTLLAPRTALHDRRSYDDYLGLVAHEHFHVWNVKRMRPAELWDYDFERENYTRLLWVAEGMTAYYDDLLCCRAGVLPPERYLQILSDQIQAVRNTPGRLVHPLSMASFDAWIKLYRPDENSRNSTQSYYTHGAMAALCLDLTIRSETDGAASLDDVMAELYRTTFGEQRGYTRDDLLSCLTRAAGRPLDDLVAALVDGPFDPDFGSLLPPFGVALVDRNEGGPYLGVHFNPRKLVVASVLRDGPAAAAHLSPGDEILAVEGLRVRRSNWSDIIRSVWREEATMELLVSRRGRIIKVAVQPRPAPHATARLTLQTDASADQVRQRDAWLQPRRARGAQDT